MSDFVKRSTALPLHRLSTYLAQFPHTWPFPRGDLNNWIPLLNRFDDILEKFNEHYCLNQGPQTKLFASELVANHDGHFTGPEAEPVNERDVPHDGDRELVERIVNFTSLLLENCGNRSLYSSSQQIGHLLNTTSLSLLESALSLALRLAQRYLASRQRPGQPQVHSVNQTLLATHYMICLDSVEQLAQPFVAVVDDSTEGASRTKHTEKGLSVVPSYAPNLLSLLKEPDSGDTCARLYGGSWVTYSDTVTAPASAAQATTTKYKSSPLVNSHLANSDSPHNSTELTGRWRGSSNENPDHSPQNTVKLLEISAHRVKNLSVEALAKEYLPQVQAKVRPQLFNRLRASKALSLSLNSRQAMIRIRLLAIANLAHIYPESVLQPRIFHNEIDEPRRSTLPYQLCDLIHPSGDEAVEVSKSLQAIALMDLESFTNHKSKAADVYSALSVGANHGILTYLVRRAVADLASETEESQDDRAWRESLFTLLLVLLKPNTLPRGTTVSAGLVDLFVEILTFRTKRAKRNHPRVLTLLDVFVYNTREAMHALINAKGLDVVSELLALEVREALMTSESGSGFPSEFKTQATDFTIGFIQQLTLRALLKFIKSRMTHSNGQFDRLLRNLIESSQLLSGLQTIIRQPQAFGSNVWSASVEMFSNFINSEPTSYPAIAEAGLTKGFLETITQRKLPETKSGSPGTSRTQDQSSIAGGLAEELLSSQDLKDKIPTRERLSRGILPNAEVIKIIPQAFRAICLIEAGMAQFEQSNALRTFFDVFQSPVHVKALFAVAVTELENLCSI